MTSPKETEVVAVLFRLTDQQSTQFSRRSHPLAVLRDHLRVQRDSLFEMCNQRPGEEAAERFA